ncbi:MAG: hypothetical protein OXM87_11840 [Truepera sp.]|nr:hypothetical protein [Truepera sp.]
MADTTKNYSVYLEGIDKIRIVADEIILETDFLAFYKGEELVARVSKNKLICYQDWESIPS